MNTETAQFDQICDAETLAAYLDGELAPAAELALEKHLARCGDCAARLNEQKKMLGTLDEAFAADFDLPADFTRKVIVKAETNVRGLRCPRERSRAVWICASLFLLILIGLGSETGVVLSAFAHFLEQTAAVGSFAARIIYDIAFGAAIILRSFARHFDFGIFALFLLLTFISLFFYLTVSRFTLRPKN